MHPEQANLLKEIVVEVVLAVRASLWTKVHPEQTNLLMDIDIVVESVLAVMTSMCPKVHPEQTILLTDIVGRLYSPSGRLCAPRCIPSRPAYSQT
jgi:hypothetical protein